MRTKIGTNKLKYLLPFLPNLNLNLNSMLNYFGGPKDPSRGLGVEMMALTGLAEQLEGLFAKVDAVDRALWDPETPPSKQAGRGGGTRCAAGQYYLPF